MFQSYHATNIRSGSWIGGKEETMLFKRCVETLPSNGGLYHYIHVLGMYGYNSIHPEEIDANPSSCSGKSAGKARSA